MKKDAILKFLKSTELRITGIEDDSSTNNVIYKLLLASPVSIKGSTVTDSGAEIKLDNVSVLNLHGNDYETFLAGCEEDGDTLVYKGKMKLDVSKPNGRMQGGQFQITRPAKGWLVDIAFNRRGTNLTIDRRTMLSNAVAGMFGRIGQDGKLITAEEVRKEMAEKLAADNEVLAGGQTADQTLTAVDTGIAKTEHATKR